MADDLGFADIGYHSKTVFTPVMDQLADNGVKLEQSYAKSVCTPSRAQFLTGRYASRLGLEFKNILPTQPNGIPLSEELLPQALKKCGYNTELIGKWHMGMYQKEFLPQYRGFDHFLGLYTGSADYWTHEHCAHNTHLKNASKQMCGYDLHEAHNNSEGVTRWDLNGQHSNDIFTSALDYQLQERDPDEPLFTYLSLQAVHGPVQTMNKFNKIYEDIYHRNPDNTRTKMLAHISSLDDAVGKVINSYKKHGYWENTIVIFSSDNGGDNRLGSSNWPLKGQKGSVSEGGIKVVSFVHSPMMPSTSRGKIYNNLMDITDWFPTILEMGQCEVEPKNPLDGVSQYENIWTNNTLAPPREEILHELNPLAFTSGLTYLIDPRSFSVLNGRQFSPKMSSAIRYENWKLITGRQAVQATTNKTQLMELSFPSLWEYTWGNVMKTNFTKLAVLYNMSADTSEKTDVSDLHPEIVDLLLTKLADYFDQSVPDRFPSYDFDANPSLRNGTWGPWIPSFTDAGSSEEIQAYKDNLSSKINYVDLFVSNNNIKRELDNYFNSQTNTNKSISTK